MIFSFFVLFLSSLACRGARLNIITKSGSANFAVSVDGQIWMQSGSPRFRNKGKDATLKLKGSVSISGSDSLGTYSGTQMTWTDSSDTSTTFMTTVKQYSDDVAVFEQFYPVGAMNTSMGKRDGVISAYPSFLLQQQQTPLGYVGWSGGMSGSAPRYGPVPKIHPLLKNSTHPALFGRFGEDVGSLPGGMDLTGPIAYFREDMNATLVVSPFSNFMAASYAPNGNVLEYGILGLVNTVPAGYSLKTILSLGNGVNDAMRRWGDKMLRYYNKPRGSHDRDFTLRYLGYSTDNGAFYYYNTEKGKNYEQTMVDIQKYSVEKGIPYKYFLLDSWWYYKGPHGGVTDWSAMPSVFPEGLSKLYNQTGWYVQAHNRYFSSENIYAKQNGGKFDFVMSGTRSLPTTQEFWDYLFDVNRAWGLIVYEQDWLSTVVDSVLELQNDATLGRKWLLQMGNAAARHNLAIQYCMSYPRHIMQSVEIPAVTQARASGDYHPNTNQWILGVSSIFSHALDIAPSKDNYWSQDDKQSRYHPPNDHEPYNRLQALVSTLSNGPVAPSDRIGYSNANLINMACNKDGLLLRPDRPATAIDSYFLKKSLNKNGPDGELWSTLTRTFGRDIFYVLAAEMKSDYSLKLSEIDRYAMAARGKMYVGFEANSTSTYVSVSDTMPLKLKSCGKHDFQFYTLVPVEANGWAFQGEMGKWISVSKQRFFSLESDQTGIQVGAHGVVGEKVTLAFMNPQKKQVKLSCMFDEREALVFKVPEMKCV